MAHTRRVDGRPETDADRRFFDARQSGYTGPIDQNGDKVASGPAKDILDALAATNRRR